MSTLQIAIVTFSLFVIIRVIIKYTQHAISFKEWITWTILWSIVGVATALPQTTDIVASKVGLETGRGVDLVVYISIPVIFYILFRLFAKIDRLESDITKIVREIAIRDINKNKK